MVVFGPYHGKATMFSGKRSPANRSRLNLAIALVVTAACVTVPVAPQARAPPPPSTGFMVTASQFPPVSGAVVLTASGFITTILVGVQFVIDRLIPAGYAGAVSALPPYFGYPLNAEITTGFSGGSVQTTWAASIEKNGAHRLAAVARYADGSKIVSSDLNLTVSNPDFYNRQLYVESAIGNDANDGLGATGGGGHGPWRTLQKAANSVVAGDTVYIKGTFAGDPAGTMNLLNVNGTAAQPIKFTSTAGQQATLSGGLTSSGKMIYNEMATGTSSYLLIDNLHLTNAIAYEPVIAFRDSDHLVISNILIDGGSNGTIRGIRFRTTSDSIIRDAQNIAVGAVTGVNAGNNGDGILINYGSQRNRIINNAIGDSSHVGITIGLRGTGGALDGPTDPAYYNVVAFNVCHNHFARCISTNQSGLYTLIEYNTMADAVSVTGTAAINSPDLLGVNSSNNTIRFNQLYGGRGTVAILLASYELNFSQIASFNEIYNNVVYDNAGQAFSFSDSSGLLSQHNKIYNNIFFHNTGISPNSPAGTTPQNNVYHFNNTVDWVTGTYGYNEVRNNIFLRDTGKAGEITITKERNSHAGGYWDIRSTISQIQSDPKLSQYWSGNLELDPQFVNAECRDFHLQPGSPAIQAGKIIPGYPYTGVGPDMGAFSSGGTPPPSTDTTPPSVSLTAPSNGATVSGSSVTVSDNATDNVGVAGVQFKLDGSNTGSEITSAPYNYILNTTLVANGTHTLTAVARDAAGNLATSASVTVTVSNSTSPPPPPSGSFSVSPSSLSFGSVAIGTTSAEGHVVVTNTSATGASLTSVALTGPFALSRNFCVANGTWNGILAPGTHCDISVVFAPTLAGNATSTLTLNAAGSSYAVGLSGTGSAPPDTTPPTVAITAPSNGATASGSSVTVSANAT